MHFNRKTLTKLKQEVKQKLQNIESKLEQREKVWVIE